MSSSVLAVLFALVAVNIVVTPALVRRVRELQTKEPDPRASGLPVAGHRIGRFSTRNIAEPCAWPHDPLTSQPPARLANRLYRQAARRGQ